MSKIETRIVKINTNEYPCNSVYLEDGVVIVNTTKAFNTCRLQETVLHEVVSEKDTNNVTIIFLGEVKTVTKELVEVTPLQINFDYLPDVDGWSVLRTQHKETQVDFQCPRIDNKPAYVSLTRAELPEKVKYLLFKAAIGYLQELKKTF